MTGSHAADYSAEVVAESLNGQRVVRMWRSGDGDDGFGAMFQVFDASAYRGKRVRWSAQLRTADVSARAALCVRVDGPGTVMNPNMLAFDTMHDRSVTGTTAWARQSCIVDVAQDAVQIFISNILAGRGELYWAELCFDVVDESTPVTDLMPAAAARPAALFAGARVAPGNLDFSSAG